MMHHATRVALTRGDREALTRGLNHTASHLAYTSTAQPRAARRAVGGPRKEREGLQLMCNSRRCPCSGGRGAGGGAVHLWAALNI